MATIAHGPAVEIAPAADYTKSAITVTTHVISDDQLVAACRKHLKYQPSFILVVQELLETYESTKGKLAKEKAEHKKTKDQLETERADRKKIQAELESTKIELAATREELEVLRIELPIALSALAETKSELEKTRAELAKTVVELSKTKSELERAQHDLHHVRDELCQTEAELKTMRHELHHTKDELRAAQAELKKTQHELCHVKDELNKSKTELTKTKDELCKTKDELTKVKADLQKTKVELAVAIAALATAQTEVVTLKSENATLKSDNTTLHATIKKLQCELDAAKEKIAGLNGKVKSLAEDLEFQQKQYKTLQHEKRQTEQDYSDEHKKTLKLEKKVKELDTRRDKLVDELADLRQQIHDLKKGRFFAKEHRSRERFYIDEVIYGGKVINNQAVINKILDHAVSGTDFHVTNSFFGEDPWPHTKKTFTCVYAVDNKAPFHYICAQEHKTVRFPSY